MHRIGPRVWWKKWKTWKMRHTHTIDYRIWRETVKKEKYTLLDLEYGDKYWKTFTMRKTHCRTWNLAKNSEEWEKWEIDTLGLEFGEKIEKRGNWDTHTLEHEIWKRNIEKHEKWEIHTVGPGMWWKNKQRKKTRGKWVTNIV